MCAEAVCQLGSYTVGDHESVFSLHSTSCFPLQVIIAGQTVDAYSRGSRLRFSYDINLSECTAVTAHHRALNIYSPLLLSKASLHLRFFPGPCAWRPALVLSTTLLP